MNSIKRLIAAILILIISSLSLAAGNADRYTIKFKIKGLPKDSNCLLVFTYGNMYPILDTAKVDASEQVIFTGKEKLQTGIYIFVMPGHKDFEFVVDDENNFTLTTDTTAGYIKNMKVEGSEANKQFFECRNFIAAREKEKVVLSEDIKAAGNNKNAEKIAGDKIRTIDSEIKKYRTNFIKQHSTSFYAHLLKSMSDPEVPTLPILANGNADSAFGVHYLRTHYWDNFDFSDGRMMRSPLLYDRINYFLDNLIWKVPDSVMATADFLIERSRANRELFQYFISTITAKFESSPILGADAVFVHLAEKYYLSKEDFWLNAAQINMIANRVNTLKPILMGKYAPNLTLKDTSLHDVTIYDVHSKYTILYFWDHSCSHCQIVTPRLIDWYHRTGRSRGVQVIAIETESDEAGWKKYIRENNLDWINVFDPDNHAMTKTIYNIDSTPKLFILDENKKIILNKLPEIDQLDRLFDYFINRESYNKTNGK